MDKELRILVLEDDPGDAELMGLTLRNAGIRYSMVRVEDKPAFEKQLDESEPDVMLIDFNLPTMDGLEALAIAQKKRPDAPFIFVSGTMGEELAIETLKNGATDYVLKSRMSRLGPAVKRAMREADMRAERRRSQRALRLMRFVMEHTPDAVVCVDREGSLRYVNPAACRYLGYTGDEIGKIGFSKVDPDMTPEKWRGHWSDLEEKGRLNLKASHRTKDGRRVAVAVTAEHVKFEGEEMVFNYIRQLSETARP